MHGHWLKGYLREGKDIEGGGGGSGGGALIVRLNGSLAGGKLVADKTFGEIEAALQNGTPVFVQYPPYPSSTMFPVLECLPGDLGYTATILGMSQTPGDVVALLSDNAYATINDYPEFSSDSGPK